MKARCLVTLIILAAFTILSQPALADDLADLKAAHMGWVKAVNTSDAETALSFWQEGGVFMPASRPFPILYKKERAMKGKWKIVAFAACPIPGVQEVF
jgi:hypothetical protein